MAGLQPSSARACRGCRPATTRASQALCDLFVEPRRVRRRAARRGRSSGRVQVGRRFADGRTPSQTLRAVRARIAELQAIQDRLWFEDLQPALTAEGIRVGGVEECSPRERRALTKRFEREIEPLLTPIAVGVAAPFPNVTSLTLNIGLLVRDAKSDEQRFIRVNVPNDVPRFVPVGYATSMCFSRR